MCGIAGFWPWQAQDQPSIQGKLQQLAALLAHRGGDGEGFFVNDYIGLAHRRLAIVDIAGGAQPLFSQDQQLVLVANGEIYNYPALRAELADYPWQSASDSEVILAVYQRFGDRGFARLEGMFAFALLDCRQRQLWLVRDGIGIKPLFFLNTAEGFYFASESKALLPFLTKFGFNPLAVQQLLLQGCIGDGQTLWSGIERLLPGQCLCLSERGLRKTWHWALLPAVAAARLGHTPRAFAERWAEWQDLFQHVLQEHRLGERPLGLFLSGGMDSSALLPTLPPKSALWTLTWPKAERRLKPGLRDEGELAQLWAKACQQELQVLEVSVDDLWQRWPAVVWAADEGMVDLANLPTFYLAEQAAAAGQKVVFSGEGGDEGFAGYGRYFAAPLEKLLKRGLRPKTGGFRLSNQWLFSGWRDLFPETAPRVLWLENSPLPALWRQTAALGLDHVQRQQLLDSALFLPENLLAKTDRMLMAHGLEGRVPFADRRLLTFALALPEALKIGRSPVTGKRQGKVFLRQGLKNLPEAIRYAPKQGFQVPIKALLTPSRLLRLEKILPRVLAEVFPAAGVQRFLARQPPLRQWWTLTELALRWRLRAVPPLLLDPIDFLEN
jgi:asparagine synthase (glutamine-hydrolysing)